MIEDPRVFSESINESSIIMKYGDSLDWWVTTVVLTFLPILLSVVLGMCLEGPLGIINFFGRGELILSTFLVILPSIIDYYKDNSIRKRHHRHMFYILLLFAIILLVIYVAIKASIALSSSQVIPILANEIPVSLALVCVGVWIAWKSWLMLRGGNGE